MNRSKGYTVLGFLLTFFIFSCSDSNLNSDFKAKRLLVKDRDLFSVADTIKERKLREAVKFLYAYMPLGDISDYDGSLYIEAAKVAISTKTSTSWGPSTPEYIFRHFVLPVRVNNESLDTSRALINRELLPRLKGLTAEEAILEVNHWCHEYVIYSPSDERTSSPLATMRNGEGRCGEESVFTVSALRAVGIPARQVYTPRWAHTDDNHAWVEAWANGKWHYIGACEPEPVLNMAWFSTSATRALLMHTRVFGRYSGPEEIIEQTDTYAEINVTENYAPVSRISLIITDSLGNSVNGAIVEYCIYNYSEFWPALKTRSDSKGMTKALMGRGDILVRAYKGDLFGIKKISPEAEFLVDTVVLDKKSGQEFVFEADIVPPSEGSINRVVTAEQISNNKIRLAEEDSIRISRLKNSPWNKPEIERFRSSVPENKKHIGETILASLSVKDYKDTPFKVLEDHLANIIENVTDPYIISPRIGRELLTPWRSYLLSIPGADTLKMNPEAIERLVSSIKIENRYNPQRIPISPAGVWRLGVADTYSRDLFFVALCRTFGVAARLNPVTSIPEYMSEKRWIKARFSASDNTEIVNSNREGTLSLTYDGKLVDDPKFESHFTISKADINSFRVLSFRNREGFEGTSSWRSVFGGEEKVTLDSGYYLLTSGSRMADGKILTRMQFFNIEAGKKSIVPLILREDNRELRVLANINVDESIIEKCGRGYFILVFLKYGDEPGNHVFSDIVKYSKEFKKWGRGVLFVYPDSNSLNSAVIKSRDLDLPSNFIFMDDPSGELLKSIAGSLGFNEETPSPLVIVADTFGRVVHFGGGYSIGTGERLIKIAGRL